MTVNTGKMFPPFVRPEFLSSNAKGFEHDLRDEIRNKVVARFGVSRCTVTRKGPVSRPLTRLVESCRWADGFESSEELLTFYTYGRLAACAVSESSGFQVTEGYRKAYGRLIPEHAIFMQLDCSQFGVMDERDRKVHDAWLELTAADSGILRRLESRDTP
jgi:hypothetical protein